MTEIESSASEAELMLIERASDGIDALIERRASEAEAEAANAVAEAWRESEQRYNLRRAAELRREWCEHHLRMIAVAEDLAERHRQQLGLLIDSAAKGG